MRSTFTGLELSKRALFAQQAALQTTGHNIANANTRGFSRQTVNFEASSPLEAIGNMRSTVPGQMGQGVEIQSVLRIREQFLDKQYYNEQKSYGEWTTRKDTLEKLEAILNEPSETGIRQVLDNFWNSWQELSKQPDNLETRAVVKESALALTDAFNHVSKKLNDLSEDITEALSVKTKQVQTMLNQVSRLNEQIFRVEGLGNNANDLRDQRDVLMDDLSKIVNISVVEEANGYHVTMGSISLVEGYENEVVSDSFMTEAVNSGDLTSGEIKGLILSRDKHVADYQTQLDVMVSTLAAAVNDTHQQGYTLKDPLEMGADFFVIDDPASAAGSLRLSDGIMSNVENIAASMRTYIDADGVERVVKGDNELALRMGDLKFTNFDFNPTDSTSILLSGGTLDEFFRAMVSEMGVQTQEAIRQSDNQAVLVEQVNSRRQAVSGVSLDEEMGNMIKFQHAYNAAARAMTSFDEMLDKVINGMGIVGR